MGIYFLLIRIAALFGHRKARMLVKGQSSTLAQLSPSSPNGNTAPKGGSLKDCIWIHAASSGEFEQARPLIEKIRQEKGSSRKIVVTFFSPSGYEQHKDYPEADGVFYLPFATRRNARRLLDALEPKTAIFVKYEFWPAYLRELHKRNIPTYSICSIFRPKQYFFRWWGKGQLKVLRSMTHLYVQDESSRRLLAEHGVHNASVAGDTRFDRVAAIVEAETSRPARQEKPTDKLNIIARFTRSCSRVIVAGSTWPEDEKLLARYMDEQLQSDRQPVTKLILVPHETNDEHLHFIFNLFKGRYIRYTSGVENENAVNGDNPHSPAIMVIDTVGLLSSLYRFGHTAYIGGGFGEGIHNTIEAAAYGIPVIFGPKYQHFREAQGLIDAGAGQSIANYKELAAALDESLDNHEEKGAHAAGYVRSELGTTEKIYADLFGRA